MEGFHAASITSFTYTQQHQDDPQLSYYENQTLGDNISVRSDVLTPSEFQYEYESINPQVKLELLMALKRSQGLPPDDYDNVTQRKDMFSPVYAKFPLSFSEEGQLPDDPLSKKPDLHIYDNFTATTGTDTPVYCSPYCSPSAKRHKTNKKYRPTGKTFTQKRPDEVMWREENSVRLQDSRLSSSQSGIYDNCVSLDIAVHSTLEDTATTGHQVGAADHQVAKTCHQIGPTRQDASASRRWTAAKNDDRFVLAKSLPSLCSGIEGKEYERAKGHLPPLPSRSDRYKSYFTTNKRKRNKSLALILDKITRNS